jgi:hypothetical protein
MLLLFAFLLVQNIAISGTLRDADGKPLAGVRVAAMSVAGSSIVGTTSTDKDGRYSLELPPGAYYVLAGNVWPTYFTANGSRVVISASQNGVDLVVTSAGFPPRSRREGWAPLPVQWNVPLPVQWDVPPTPPKFPLSPR